MTQNGEYLKKDWNPIKNESGGVMMKKKYIVEIVTHIPPTCAYGDASRAYSSKICKTKTEINNFLKKNTDYQTIKVNVYEIAEELKAKKVTETIIKKTGSGTYEDYETYWALDEDEDSFLFGGQVF